MTDIKAGEGHFEENTELSFAEMLEESLKKFKYRRKGTRRSCRYSSKRNSG